MSGERGTAPCAAPSRRSAVGRRQGLTCTTAAPRLGAVKQVGARPPLLPETHAKSGGGCLRPARPPLAARSRREARGYRAEDARRTRRRVAELRGARAPKLSAPVLHRLPPCASPRRPGRADDPRAPLGAYGGPRHDESFRQQPLQRRWGALHTCRRQGGAASRKRRGAAWRSAQRLAPPRRARLPCTGRAGRGGRARAGRSRAHAVAHLTRFAAQLSDVITDVCTQLRLPLAQCWARSGRAGGVGALRTRGQACCVAPPLAAFRERCCDARLQRGEGFPGRVWQLGGVVWGDALALPAETYGLRDAAAAAGLRTAVAVAVARVGAGADAWCVSRARVTSMHAARASSGGRGASAARCGQAGGVPARCQSAPRDPTAAPAAPCASEAASRRPACAARRVSGA